MKTHPSLTLIVLLASAFIQTCRADDPTAVLRGGGGGTILSLHDNLRAPLQWSHPTSPGGGGAPMQQQQPSPQQQLMMLQQEMNRVRGIMNAAARDGKLAAQYMQAAANAQDAQAYGYYQQINNSAAACVQEGQQRLAWLQQQARMIVGQ